MSNPIGVDSHIHIFFTPEESLWYTDYKIWEYGKKDDVAYSGKMPTSGCPSHLNYVEDVLQTLDNSGFDQGLVLNLFPGDIVKQQAIEALPNEMPASAREKAIREIDLRVHEEMVQYNTKACAQLKNHPQLHSFVSVNPTASIDIDHYRMLEELKRDHGAKGIKMHHALYERDASDPCIDEIYQASIDLDMPIVAHCGRCQTRQHSDPNAFYDALKKFPALRLVVAHVGGSSWQQTKRLADAFPNIGFDICEIIEWMGAPNGPSNKDLAQLIKDIGTHRVFLGSDYPWYDIEHSKELLMGLPLLSREEKDRIVGDNAIRFFGL